MSYSQIPHDWFEFRNHFGRFITYWGDIYSGTLWECPDYDQGFFIVPNYHLLEINGLNAQERTPERYRQLGHEINDHRIIIHRYRIELDTREFESIHPPPISTFGHEFKDMFIFGAGASAHCCFGEHKERYEKDRWRSPLGYDIFNEKYEELCIKYPGLRQAIPEFEIRNNTIEECLEEDWNLYSTKYFPELPRRHINVQFYLQELFRKISSHTIDNYYRKNLYQLFVSQLRKSLLGQSKRKGVVVNFNYDTILDSFIESALGYKTERIDDYIDIERRSIAHFKPHGSCNWGWGFPVEVVQKHGKDIARVLYDHKVSPADLYYRLLGNMATMVNEYSYGYEMHGKKIGKHTLNKLKIALVKEEPAYPALLLPFKEKDEFVMPYHHQTALGLVIGDIERLFVIGWKGSEQLFLNQLEKANRIKEVIIVNPEFETVKSNLGRYIKEPCTWTHVQDFEAFINREMI